MITEQDKLPTSKVARASSVFRTSMRVGANYIKHNAQKLVGSSVSEDDLNDKNAEELFQLMSQLKGSALKIAQMLSMDTGVLPKSYAEKFAFAQNSAMALSTPLVMNTFVKYIVRLPNRQPIWVVICLNFTNCNFIAHAACLVNFLSSIKTNELKFR